MANDIIWWSLGAAWVVLGVFWWSIWRRRKKLALWRAQAAVFSQPSHVKIKGPIR
jgi:hypothetical protein